MEQLTPLSGTISCAAAATVNWDAIVMGAGVAGSLAARELARSGLRVLLVDKRGFPRPKVCGGCLNGTAMSILSQVGLSNEIEALNGPFLTTFALRGRSSSVILPLPSGRAISRDRLDLTLAQAAIRAGAEFLPETTASVGVPTMNGRNVELCQRFCKATAESRTIVVATGLGSHGLPETSEWSLTVAPSARVGVSCVLDELNSGYSAGTIWMAIGDGGYVGLVRVEDGRLNVAAVFDLDFVRRHGSPGNAAVELLKGAGSEIPRELREATWHGTLPLTRQASPSASRRVFLIGDATGYVEPFTGEGMAWSLSAGLRVVPWVRQAAKEWSDDCAHGWIREHQLLVRRRQNVCRVLVRLLRCPRLLRCGMFLVQRWPGLLRRVVDRLNASSSSVIR